MGTRCVRLGRVLTLIYYDEHGLVAVFEASSRGDEHLEYALIKAPMRPHRSTSKLP